MIKLLNAMNLNGQDRNKSWPISD